VVVVLHQEMPPQTVADQVAVDVTIQQVLAVLALLGRDLLVAIRLLIIVLVEAAVLVQ
jgi:uncharacterized membrane protein